MSHFCLAKVFVPSNYLRSSEYENLYIRLKHIKWSALGDLGPKGLGESAKGYKKIPCLLMTQSSGEGRQGNKTLKHL